jgi:hypothetical protein
MTGLFIDTYIVYINKESYNEIDLNIFMNIYD